MSRLAYFRVIALAAIAAGCSSDSLVAPAIVRSRIDGSPLDPAMLRSLRAKPLGCILFRSSAEEMEFAVVTNRDLGGTLIGPSSGGSLHEVTLRLWSAGSGVIAADCIVDGATSRDDLALRWEARSNGGQALAAAVAKLSWRSVRTLRKGLEAREVRHEMMNNASAASGLSLALDPIIVIGYRPPELSDRESAAYDAYCNQYDYYDGEQAMLSDATEGGGGGGGEGTGVDNTGTTDTTTTEDSSAVCDPAHTAACLDTLPDKDKLIVDSSMKLFDTTSNALCKEARDSVQAFLNSGRVYRGKNVLLDGHDGMTSDRKIHIDGDYLDAASVNPIGPTRLLELLLHEGFHAMGKAHPKSEPYPYTTEPFNLPASGNPPCVRQP